MRSLQKSFKDLVTSIMTINPKVLSPLMKDRVLCNVLSSFINVVIGREG